MRKVKDEDEEDKKDTHLTLAMDAGRALAGVFVLLGVAMPVPRPEIC